MCLLNPQKIEVTEPITCYKVVEVAHIPDGRVLVGSPIMRHIWIPGYEDHDTWHLDIHKTSPYSDLRELGAESVLFGGAFHVCETFAGAKEFLEVMEKDRGTDCDNRHYAIGEFIIPTTSKYVYEGYHTYDNITTLGDSLASEALIFVKLVEQT